MTGSTLLEHQAEAALDERGAFNISAATSRTRLDLGEPSNVAVKPAAEPAAMPTPEGEPSPNFSSSSIGPMYMLSLNRLEATNSATVQFSSRAHDAQPYSPLSVSLEALSRAASKSDAGAWLDAAATLKRDAIRLRNSSAYGRHAAVLLTLADALTFTRPADPTLRPGASSVLQRGLAVLTDPFVSTDAERELMRNLLSHGWNIAPASEGLPPAS